MPLQASLVAEAQARIDRGIDARRHAAPTELANYFVGQVVGRMNTVKPARQVVLDMVNEYIDVAEKFTEQLSS